MCSKQNRRLHAKIQDTRLNIHVFNLITGINESKILTKHISCDCEYKFGGRKCNSNQKWKNDKCVCESKIRKNIMCVKTVIFGILLRAVKKIVNM